MKRLLLSVIFQAVVIFGSNAQTATVNLNATRQVIKGFGGINHPTWYSDLNAQERELCFGNGTNQLGLTVLRTYVSDNSNEWGLGLQTAQRAVALGATVFASPWNPPSSMTITVNGQKRINPNSFGAYADHLNSYVTYMRNNGVDLYAISTQNEPDYAHDWTEWSPQESVDFIKGFANRIDCRLMTPESFQYRKNVYDPILNDPQALANVDIFGTHLYGTRYADFPYPLFQQKGAGKELWMTEVYTDSQNDANIWDNGAINEDRHAIKVAEHIHYAMVDGQFQTYVFWPLRRYYALVHDGQGPVGATAGTATKRGYCMAQFSKWVRPGFVRVDATKSPSTNVFVSAYKKDNDVVIVVVNKNTATRTLTLDIPGTQVTTWEQYTTSATKNIAKGNNINAGSSFQVTLDAASVTTFVGKGNAGFPTVQITAPSNNASFQPGESVTINATASDPNGTIANVKFYNGNTLLTTDNTAPYSHTLTNLTYGSYALRAVATDNQGNVANSEIVNIGVQGPYNNTPHPIPGTIQLEEYDLGGNGFAYYDNTPGSQVTPVVNYRTTEDVDIENCTDTGGGYNLGWTAAGEWVEYTVDVTKPGIYELQIRAACNGDDRTLSVSMDGEDIATNVAIPNTAGWQAWQTITVDDIELTEGEKIMRVSIGATDYINLNYVTFNLIEEFVQSPYNGTPHPIPGRIEAEEYDFGREGIGYHEANENGNQGNSDLRGDEVDIEVTGDVDGELNIAYTLTGEWLAYTVDVASTGLYDVDLRVAKDGAGGSLHIEFDGVNVTGAIAVPNTGAWQTYQTVTVNDINLTAGEHEMRIVFDTDYMNLNYVVFTAVIQDADNDGTPDEEDVCPNDPNKATTAGQCGCGNAETDSDGDGIANCVDNFPNDKDNDGVTTANDCDDNNASIGAATVWYQDTDGDGVGVSNNTQTSCTKPTGYVATAGDECPNDINKTTPGNCGCGNTEESCLDCAGTPNGTAFIDNCDNCVATQQEACEQDCNGDWGGTAVIDACNECTGGSTGLPVITDPTKCVATGIEEIKDSFEIYPNPFTKGLTIKLEGAFTYVIYDVTGSTVESGKGTNELTVGKQLIPGMYFISIESNESEYVLKIVKQ